jgi:hypothetical protein
MTMTNEEYLDRFFQQQMKYAVKPSLPLDSITGIDFYEFSKELQLDPESFEGTFMIKMDTEVLPVQRFINPSVVKPLPMKVLTMDVKVESHSIFIPKNVSYKVALCHLREFKQDPLGHGWEYAFFVQRADIHKI